MVVVGILALVPILSLAEAGGNTRAGSNVNIRTDVTVKWLGGSGTSIDASDQIGQIGSNSVEINVNELGTLVTNQDIVIIDQASLNDLQLASVSADLTKVIESGIPVILINNDQYLLSRAADRIQTNTNEDKAVISAENRSVEGNHISQLYAVNCTIYGLRYYPSTGGSSTYSGGSQGQQVDAAQVRSAYSWAFQKIGGSSELASGSAPASSGAMSMLLTPHWVHDTDFTYSEPADTTHGYMNVVTNYYYLADDGDSNFNYYYVKYGLLDIPGQTGYWGWSNGDMNINTQNLAALGSDYPTRWLIDYSPTTQVSGSIISVSIDANGPAVGWSFPFDPVGIYNQCDLGAPRAQWWYDIDEDNLQFSQSLYVIHPGAEVKTEQLWGGYYHVNYDKYSITWFHWNGLWEESYTWTAILSGNVYPL